MSEEANFEFSDLKTSSCESIHDARMKTKSVPQMGGRISAIKRRFVCHCTIQAIQEIAKRHEITMTSPLADKMVRAILGRGVGTEILRVNFAKENRNASIKLSTADRDRAIQLATDYSKEINDEINKGVEYLNRFSKVHSRSAREAEINRLQNAIPPIM
ncbi:hypothetical protein L4D09_00220 [Photobacterium makurazakiensis]|uniref:hypothetical protein n=1 Tax=Photobacterium makurazakiensis TaxID=2910234 RepID=UPI003D0B992D